MTEAPLNIVIVGGDRKGLETLSVLANDRGNNIVLLVEPDKNALVFRLGAYGMQFSGNLNITMSHKLSDISSLNNIGLIVDASDNPNIHREIYSLNLSGTEVMKASSAKLLWELRGLNSLSDRQSLILQEIKAAFEEVDIANDEIEFYALLLEAFLLAIGGRSSELYIRRGGEKRIEFEFKRDLVLDGLPRWVQNPLEKRIASSVLERCEPIILRGDINEPDIDILLEDPIMAFPISSEGETIGVIEVMGLQRENEISDHDLIFITHLTSLAERYLRKLLALREVKEISLHESLRRALNENLNLEIPITERLNKCLDVVARSLNFKWYSLYIKDPYTKDLVLQASNEIGQRMMGLIRIKDGIGIIGETSKSGRIICLRESSSLYSDGDSRWSQANQEIICIPMIASTGVVGVISFVIPDLKGRKERALKFLEEISRILAGSIASDTERHRMSQKVLKLSVVNEEGLELLSAIDRDKVLRLATASAAMIIDAEAVIIRLLEKKDERLIVGSTYGLHNDDIDKRLVDFDVKIADMVVEKKTAVSISDLKEIEDLAEPFPYNAVLSLPLIWEEKLIGTLSVYNKLVYNSFSCTYFNEDDKEILEKYAQYVARAILNAQHYKDREALITIDELTGLKNERYLQIRLPEEVRRADRYQRAISLIFIEIDKFKDIVNDMQVEARKEVIRRLAGIIRDNFRNVDIIVRLGEARFAVLMPDTGERVIEAIQRLTNNMRSIKVRNLSTCLSVSLRLMVGYSTYPHDSPDIKTLVDNASKLLPVG